MFQEWLLNMDKNSGKQKREILYFIYNSTGEIFPQNEKDERHFFHAQHDICYSGIGPRYYKILYTSIGVS